MSRIEGAPRAFGLSLRHAVIKRAFDLGLAVVLLLVLLVPTMILVAAARIDTGQSGIFRQRRIGLFGVPFTIYKIRTMRPATGIDTTVTTLRDPRITRLGALLRRSKCDEFPQLFNVLNGTMSFVGPRPDVEDTYRNLNANALRILSVRPGITGPSSVAFRDEEALLASVEDPERYNAEVLFPEKVRINLHYIDNYSLWTDLKVMVRTVLG